MIFVELPFVPILEALQDNLKTVEKYVVLCEVEEMPKTSLKNAISYEEYIEDGDENYKWPNLADDAACALCYTSGTTGNPKGVLYSHKSNIIHAQASLTALTIQSDDSILMVVPLFHVLAWGIPYFGAMNGLKLVMPGMQMEGEPLYELIDQEDVTLAFGVPTIWMGLLAYCRENNKILTSVRNTIIGGSALSLATLQEFDEVHDVNVIHAWGMTEMSPLGTTNVPTQEMKNMQTSSDGRTQLEFLVPSRGLIGFRGEFVRITRGEGIMSHSFYEYKPKTGNFETRRNGVLIAFEEGVATFYALKNAEDRGIYFIKPGVKVYKGMIIGENNRPQDLELNICKTKQLTNMRSAGAEELDTLQSPVDITLERALEYIGPDEMLEVTPDSIRMRKINKKKRN